MILKCIQYGFFFCILLSFAGCKKDPIITADNNSSKKCIPLPDSPPLGWQYTTRNKSLNVSKAIYDPINSNLIYYLSEDSLSNPFLLWKFNRGTNIKIQLDNKLNSQPSINKKNWLTYTKRDFNVYIIKSNGDSLIKITSTGLYNQPVWDSDNNILAYNSSLNCIVKLNINGQILDTLSAIKSYISVKDSFMLYFSTSSISQKLILKNIKTNNDQVIFENQNVQAYYNFFLDTENKNIYTLNSSGLYKTNIHNKIPTLIIQSCQTENYINFSLNYKNDFILTKVSTKQLNDVTLYNQSDLFEQLNSSNNQTLINIPNP